MNAIRYIMNMPAQLMHAHLFFSQDSVVLSPRAQTNSAFQTDAENGYFTISLREPGKYNMLLVNNTWLYNMYM